MWRGEKLRKMALLTRSKLNSTEKIISEGLADSDVNLDEFTQVINGKLNYSGLKKNRVKDDQCSNIERNRWTGHCKKNGVDEVHKAGP